MWIFISSWPSRLRVYTYYTSVTVEYNTVVNVLQCITGRPTGDHWHDSLYHDRRVLPLHPRVDCSQEQEPNTGYRGLPKFLRERVQWMPMGITPKHAFTIPVTSCEWKKGASALNLKWLKTFTRANMTEDRLSSRIHWPSYIPIIVFMLMSMNQYFTNRRRFPN